MPIIKKEDWEKKEETNKDPYGKCCIDVAREVMRLLDTEEYKDFDCHKIICSAEKNVGEKGITGFMAGMIAQIVSYYHSRGKEFRKKWNTHYGITEEKAKGGMVNPAIMSVGK